MSRENPTPLRIGSSGTLNHWRVRVAGRLVMSMEDAGETWYWNEYHLLDDAGTSATLVFEETESGAEWKLFREWTPSRPITAREAATKRVGDTVNLDGTPTRITLVDQSRVYHIEGIAPEGVEVGDIAHYFNADAGTRMLVASWTGDEIEFYEGFDASAENVADAFNIPRDATPGTANHLAAATRNAGSSRASGGAMLKIVGVLLSAASLFSAYSCFSSHRNVSTLSRPRAKVPAPAAQLPLGTHAALRQHEYIVDARKLIEIARVTGRHELREYQLRDEASRPALLIHALSGGTKEWHLLRTAEVPAEMTPYEAAMKRKSTTITVNGRAMRIVDLFRASTLGADGSAGTRATSAAVQYGFVATEAGNLLVARWSENQIQFLLGTAVTDAEIAAAFGGKAAK